MSSLEAESPLRHVLWRYSPKFTSPRWKLQQGPNRSWSVAQRRWVPLVWNGSKFSVNLVFLRLELWFCWANLLKKLMGNDVYWLDVGFWGRLPKDSTYPRRKAAITCLSGDLATAAFPWFSLLSSLYWHHQINLSLPFPHLWFCAFTSFVLVTANAREMGRSNQKNLLFHGFFLHTWYSCQRFRLPITSWQLIYQ